MKTRRLDELGEGMFAAGCPEAGAGFVVSGF
jgi:hypothetical protein